MVALVGTEAGDFLDIQEDTTSVQGLAGDDTIAFGLDLTSQTTAFAGGVIDGGDGQDSLNLAGFVGTTTITVDGVAYDSVIDLNNQTLNLGSQTITLVSIERAFGSEGNDLIIGANNGFFDVLAGGAGNDYIISGADGSFIVGGGANGAGADTYDGSQEVNGFSIVSYGDETSGLRVDLVDASQGTGGAEGDVFIQIDELQATGFDDVIVTDGSGVQVRAQAGDDTIITGLGTGRLDGGDGTDTLSLENATQGIFVNLNTSSNGGGSILTTDFQTFFQNVENFENIIGSDFDDNLIGNGGDNIFFGSGGADQFNGDFNSNLNGPDGDGGNDTVTYENAAEGVNASLTGTTTNILGVAQADRGIAAGDTYSNIDNLIGSEFRDFLTGDDNSNQLDGNGGSDFLYGNGGDDVLNGGEGRDVLAGGLGADTLDGGEGRDYADYRDFGTTDVDISLATGSSSEGDTLLNIEAVFGSDGVNTITGDDANNFLYGVGGDDTIDGGAGNDFIQGGAGDDTLTAGDGTRDILFGNDGADTFTFSDGETGRSILADFDVTEGDVIDLTDFAEFASVEDVQAASMQVRNSLFIDLGDVTVVLFNTTAEDLTSDYFDFAGAMA